MRIVALFDLPANVFAETGVNTTLIVAYRPSPADLRRLQMDGYSVYVKDIKKVGYEKRTSKRNVFFRDIFRVDPGTFEVETGPGGAPVLNEQFSETLAGFERWALGQEQAVRNLFIGAS